ncbi:MAG: AmmeMemoRadiSam system protein B [Gammaproteobacteria bacterium]|nr:AmmeMemoRadiSam system protein B [Gammaproteobacteria bacterium]MDH5799173.1 AmmeMemoRadiSam system protein B [Gammaproteobacteria bacterium]
MIRQAAVSNMFYPGDPQQLRQTLQTLLQPVSMQSVAPKAIIAPHAGYIYSGPVAASAYRRLETVRSSITRVVLLGPSHRVPLFGCACSGATAFATPLGDIPLDQAAIESATTLPFVKVMDQAHSLEHSLEVHLPFLQMALDRFSLVPIVVGDCPQDQVAILLEQLWGGEETLIVISSDLSHYHDYETAKRLDAVTCQAIESLDINKIDSQHACGAVPLKGLLCLLKRKSLKATLVDCRNSGDTAGPRHEVVGYAAFVVEAQ